MILSIKTEEGSYPIVLEKGGLSRLKNRWNLSRKVLVLTDSGVPSQYAQTVLSQCQEGFLYTFLQGEAQKSFATYQKIIAFLIEKQFTRSDCIVCVGGGVCGDLGGFVASTYMRGIDFYNVPTTLLACVDSSIGGKVAVDFENVKNVVGAFYSPKGVLVDVECLQTLPKRQFNAGLCESIKMAITLDGEFFETLERTTDFEKEIETIILNSLQLKKDVVEKDPKEKGLRSVLNFGHTIGHGVESAKKGELLHGECVALGMLYFAKGEAKERLQKLLYRIGLPTRCDFDTDAVYSVICHDKKAVDGKIKVVLCESVGTCTMELYEKETIFSLLKGENQ